MSRYTRLMNLLMQKRAAAVKAFAVALILSVMAGCSTTKPVYHDYTLVVAPVSSEDKVHSALPATLGVFPVNVPGWLDKKNITWSDGGVRLKTFDNDHWGEPLPDLLTQAMVQNFRRQVGTRSWISYGPWARDKRPEIVAFIDVQSISVVNHQLRVNVAWLLEGQGSKIIARREKVYGLPLEHGDSVPGSVQTLSRVWGLVAEDMIQALTSVEVVAQG